MASKEINYLNRDFDGFRQSLLDFAKSYFPNTHRDFTEASPGTLFLEQAAYIGDVLSFYIDKQLKEQFLGTANERSSIYEIVQNSNYKPKTNTSAFVDLEITQEVPSKLVDSVYVPDLDYALTIDEGMIIESNENSNIEFRTIEPVDFKVNKPDNPRREVVSLFDQSNNPSFYQLTKIVRAKSGKVKQKEISFGSPIPYDKVIIEDNNVLEIISVIDSDNNTWHEVETLGQDSVYTSVPNVQRNDPDLATYSEDAPFLLKRITTDKRYVTRVRNDNKIEVQFGSGVSNVADVDLVPNINNQSILASDFQKVLDTSTDPNVFYKTNSFGQAPSNTTITFKYTIGFGIAENTPPNTLTNITSKAITIEDEGLDAALLARAKASVFSNNIEPGSGAKDIEDLEELKIVAQTNSLSQNRIVTQPDLLTRALSMPARFGSIAKAYAEKEPGDSIATSLYILSYGSDGNYEIANLAIKENLKNYLNQYRMMTDAIVIRDALIINFEIQYEIVPDGRVTNQEVLSRTNNTVRRFFSRPRMQIRRPINITELRQEIGKVAGVQFINDITLINKFGAPLYSNVRYNFNQATRNDIVFPPLDPSIFEIRNPDTEIKGRIGGA